MSNGRQPTEHETAAGRGAGAILDGTVGFAAIILTVALLTMIRSGLDAKVLLIVAAYTGIALLLGRRHGWSFRNYVGRLRGAPNALGGDADEH